MRRRIVSWLLLVFLLVGCGPLQVEAGFEPPAQLTATARLQSESGQGAQLGKLAYVQEGDIWVRQLPDGTPKRLTATGQNSAPRWSPSGQWLAFREDSHLWIERGDGTNAHVVEGGAGIDQYAWSPVDDRLAYVEQGGLSVETADGSHRWRLIPTTTRPLSGVRTMAWSPDGHWLAYDRADRRLQGLWRVAAEGSPPQVIYRDLHSVQTQCYLAGWSPDGSYLLFWRASRWSPFGLPDGAPLFSVPVGGGRLHQIAFTLLHPDFLSWSPDGKRLALVAGSGRATWSDKAVATATVHGSLHRLHANQSGPARYADLYPAWSPDGRWIAVTRGPVSNNVGSDVAGLMVERRRIWLIAADGTGARQLTRSSKYRDERPQWSADGSAILFVRMNGKFAQLWLMQADGSQQREVADGLLPAPSLGFWGYYGYVQWDQLYDWWTGHARS